MTIALSPSLYASDEVEELFEIGILEEDINFELEREYQSTPSTRFEVAIVSRSRERTDLPLWAVLVRGYLCRGSFHIHQRCACDDFSDG